LEYVHKNNIKNFYVIFILDDCKFLIFAHHKVVLDGIEQHVIKKKIDYIRIDGSILNEKRHQCVNKFQTNDNCKIAILGITACATGLTLTKASTVVFAEIYFTPAVMIQAEDRAHRIGQEHNSVNVHYLIGRDTVDDIIFPKLEDKFTVVSNTLDAKKLNMEMQNVQKGGKGEIEVGKSSKNNLETNFNSKQKNILNDKKSNNVENLSKNDNEKSANKTKITDFFSKKTSSVSNNDLSSLDLNLTSKSEKEKYLVSKKDIKSENIENQNSNNHFSKALENINKINILEEDSFEDVLEGYLNDEALINQIFDNGVYGENSNLYSNLDKEKDYFRGDNVGYFNLHKQTNGKRTREEMNNINDSISKKEKKSHNVDIENTEDIYEGLFGNKEIKKK